MLAAEYTNGSKTRPATLQVTVIADGRRTFLHTFTVANKREARKLAAAHGAKCWNF